MKNHIILYRSNNTPNKSDATGAFQPEARVLAKLLPDRYPGDRVAIRGVDLSGTKGLPKEQKQEVRRTLSRDAIRNCFDQLGNPVQATSLSYFCHGWRRAVEFELGGLHGAHACAGMLVDLGIKYFNLFACSTGKPHADGNFAEWVTRACAERRHAVQVLAHETSGHTTWNAKLAVFWSYKTTNLRGERSQYTVSIARSLDRDQNQLLEPGAAWDDFAEHMKRDQNYRLLLPFMLDE